MQKKIDFTSNFEELKTWDPRIKVTNGEIRLIPQYFNYPFLLKFLLIFILIYIIRQQNDTFLNTACFALIAVCIILIISQLKFYNTVHIDKKNKLITVCPNILIRFLGKKKMMLEFAEIKKVTVLSNFYSTGFWLAYRRYYITFILNDEEELKLIGSNTHDNALKVTEKIASIL